jgi:hypothetical protein
MPNDEQQEDNGRGKSNLENNNKDRLSSEKEENVGNELDIKENSTITKNLIGEYLKTGAEMVKVSDVGPHRPQLIYILLILAAFLIVLAISLMFGIDKPWVWAIIAFLFIFIVTVGYFSVSGSTRFFQKYKLKLAKMRQEERKEKRQFEVEKEQTVGNFLVNVFDDNKRYQSIIGAMVVLGTRSYQRKTTDNNGEARFDVYSIDRGKEIKLWVTAADYKDREILVELVPGEKKDIWLEPDKRQGSNGRVKEAAQASSEESTKQNKRREDLHGSNENLYKQEFLLGLKVLLEWILVGIRKFQPGFESWYKKQIVYDYREMNLKGLQTQGATVLLIDEVFVHLKIGLESVHRIVQNPLGQKRLEESAEIWDFLRNRLNRKSKNKELGGKVPVVILGAPGSGKSTLLQHVAVILAKNKQRKRGLKPYVPILFFLREYVNKIIEGDKDLGDLCAEYYGNKERYKDLKYQPGGWFEKQLNKGRCLVLLDGLDEVADPEKRKKISKWINNQVRKYRNCQFLLTSRPEGYKSAPLEGADTLEVQNFTSRQSREFVNKWYYSTIKTMYGGKVDQGVEQKAEQKARDFWLKVREKPELGLEELTVNPLLLTMMTLVHNYRGALPQGRANLYGEICKVLLGERRQALGVEERLSAEKKLVVLKPLAAYMMEQRIRDIKVEDISQVIKEYLKRVGVKGREGPEKFLIDVRDNSGLLQEKEVGIWSFAHLTFQEYLTGVHWLDTKDTKDWMQMVEDSWWREALRLYSAQGDATGIVRACLQKNTIATLLLASECTEEALTLEDQVEDELNKILEEGLDSEEIDRFQLVTEVKLLRRLRGLGRQEEKGVLDKDYITTAEYQLFLDEKRTAGEFLQPDHWNNIHFQSGEGKKPILGTRYTDAEAFCEWLTRREGGNSTFRLPTPEEVKTQLKEKRTDDLGVWCFENGEYSLVGLDESKLNEIKMKFVKQDIFPSITFHSFKPLSKNILKYRACALDKIFMNRLIIIYSNKTKKLQIIYAIVYIFFSIVLLSLMFNILIFLMSLISIEPKTFQPFLNIETFSLLLILFIILIILLFKTKQSLNKSLGQDKKLAEIMIEGDNSLPESKENKNDIKKLKGRKSSAWEQYNLTKKQKRMIQMVLSSMIIYMIFILILSIITNLMWLYFTIYLPAIPIFLPGIYRGMRETKKTIIRVDKLTESLNFDFLIEREALQNLEKIRTRALTLSRILSKEVLEAKPFLFKSYLLNFLSNEATFTFPNYSNTIHYRSLLNRLNIANKFSEAINCDIVEAKSLAITLSKNNYINNKRLGILFSSMLECVSAQKLKEAIKLQNKYLITMVVYTWLGYRGVYPSSIFSKRKRKKELEDMEKDRQTIAELYWWLKITEERRNGSLPAWESIIVVRESRKEGAD